MKSFPDGTEAEVVFSDSIQILLHEVGNKWVFFFKPEIYVAVLSLLVRIFITCKAFRVVIIIKYFLSYVRISGLI